MEHPSSAGVSFPRFHSPDRPFPCYTVMYSDDPYVQVERHNNGRVLLSMVPCMWVSLIALSLLSAWLGAMILFYTMRIYVLLIKDPHIVPESIGFYEGNFENIAKTHLRALRFVGEGEDDAADESAEPEKKPDEPVDDSLKSNKAQQSKKVHVTNGARDEEEKTDLGSRKDLLLASGKAQNSGRTKKEKLKMLKEALTAVDYKSDKKVVVEEQEMAKEAASQMRTVEATREAKEAPTQVTAAESAVVVAPAKKAAMTQVDVNSKVAPVKTPNSKEALGNTTKSKDGAEKETVSKTPNPAIHLWNCTDARDGMARQPGITGKQAFTKNHTCNNEIRELLVRICRFLLEREYEQATTAYIDMSIGKAPWPVGVTRPGINLRPGPAKAYTSNTAQVLNDEKQRKFIQAFKRLITRCQKWFPIDPSK